MAQIYDPVLDQWIESETGETTQTEASQTPPADQGTWPVDQPEEPAPDFPTEPPPEPPQAPVEFWDANAQRFVPTGMTPEQIQQANVTTPMLYRVDGQILEKPAVLEPLMGQEATEYESPYPATLPPGFTIPQAPGVTGQAIPLSPELQARQDIITKIESYGGIFGALDKDRDLASRAIELGLYRTPDGVPMTLYEIEQMKVQNQQAQVGADLLPQIESLGGVAGAIQAGQIDLVRQAIDAGLYTVKDSETGLDRRMNQVDLVDMQSKLADIGVSAWAISDIQRLSPGSYSQDGIIIEKALIDGVDPSVLRIAGISQEQINIAQNNIRAIQQDTAQPTTRPPLEAFIAQYSNTHPVKFPEGMSSFEKMQYLNNKMAEDRVEATKLYQEQYGKGGLLAGAGLAIGEVFTPAFKILEPSIEIGDLTAMDKIILAAQIASIVIPPLVGALSPKFSGPIVKYAPGTAIEDIAAGRAKGVPVEGLGEIRTLEGRLVESPINFKEGPAPFSADAPAIWQRGSQYYIIYGENGRPFGVPVSSLESFGQPLKVVYEPSGGVWRPSYYIGKEKIRLEGEWNPDALVASGRMPSAPPRGGGAATAPATELGRMTPEQAARFEPALSPSRMYPPPLLMPTIFPVTAIPPNVPETIPMPVPIREPETIPVINPLIIPAPSPAPVPVATPVPLPVSQPVGVPQPVTTSAPAPSPVAEPIPIPTPVPTPPGQGLIPPPVPPVIIPPKITPPPIFPEIAGGSLYRGGQPSGIATNTNLRGKITDIATNLPISMALVKITSSAGAVTQKYTDKDGNYQFIEINPDYYSLIASKQGYESVQARFLVNPGENRFDIKQRQAIVPRTIIQQAVSPPGQTTIVQPAMPVQPQRTQFVKAQPGVYAVDRGEFWLVAYPPYQANNLVHMKLPPPEAKILDSLGAIYKGIQSSGGNGAVLLAEFQISKHDKRTWNKNLIRVDKPRALKKWLKNPGSADVVGIDTPKKKTRKAVMIRKKK